MLLHKIGRLTAILAGEVSTLVGLHRLGSFVPAIQWGTSGRWLTETPPEDAIVAVVRLLALAIAWWLTASTLLYMAASATRMTTLVRGVRWATLPTVRRFVDGLLASTIVVGTTLGPAQVATAQSNKHDPVVVERDAIASESARNPLQQVERISPQSPYHPTPAGDAAPPAGPELRTPTPGGPPSFATYTVEQGDSLWRIAERQMGPSAVEAAVRTYWIHLVEANVRGLASGKPDLIYPHEVIQLQEPP